MLLWLQVVYETVYCLGLGLLMQVEFVWIGSRFPPQSSPHCELNINMQLCSSFIYLEC